MVDVGDEAPDFTVPKASGKSYNAIEEFTLSNALGDGPVILAFFPAIFTSGCTEEMCQFRNFMDEFDEVSADIYGISVDLPFAQNIFIQEHNLNFPLLSDFNQNLIYKYDIILDDLYGIEKVAERSVFIINEEGTVIYKWVRDDSQNPDFKSFVGSLVDEIR